MMKSARSVIVTLFSLFLLSACVTETTNPLFNVEKSDEEALQDYLQLAIGYLEQDELASAKRHLQNAASIDPNNSEMFGIWALIYTREGEMDLADEYFRRALRVDRNNSKARNNYAAFLFARDRIEDAYEQLEVVVQDTEYEQRPQAFENMGVAALQLDRKQEAEQAFSRALQLNPNQLRSALELAQLNLDRGDVLQARAYWRSYLTLIQFYNLGHNARSLLMGARLEFALQNEDNARQYGEMLRTNFPESPEYQAYVQISE
jgi:type IV pilus assembly protein PilF